MTSNCKLCKEPVMRLENISEEDYNNLTCGNKLCSVDGYYTHDEWEKLNSDDGRRDLYRQVVLAGTMQINRPLVAIAWSWPLDKDSEIILSYRPIEGA